jgi:DNA excision repair protein ERCC-2
LKVEDGGVEAEAARFPYPKPRPGQLEVARAIAESVRRGEVFLLNAPTGFGKTVSVLYGLLLAGVERVLYLVRTRNEIEPVLRELHRLGVERFSFLYSARRMCPLLRGEKLSTEDFWETCRLLRLRGECLYYNNFTETSEETIRAIVEGVEPRTPQKIVSALSSAGLCPFFSLKLIALDSQIIVATYPYLFREDIFTSVFEPLTYSDFVVVVDEAHSLLNIQSMLEARISLENLYAAEAEVERYKLPRELGLKLERLAKLLREAKPRGEGYWRIDKDRVKSIIEDPQVWFDAAQEVRSAKLREKLEGGDVKLSVALTRVALFAEMVFRDDTRVYVKGDKRKVLVALPLEPASVASKPLSEARAVILLSGTMPPSMLIRSVLGLDRPMRVYEVELFHGPIFPRENMKTILTLELTSRATDRSREMYEKYALYILSTYQCVSRSVLVVYPSYDFMSNILAAINAVSDGGLESIVEGPDTSIESVVERVRSKKHVLINAVAGGKLTEGVEFTEEGSTLLSAVFVAGVPYPRPDDYVSDMYQALAARAGEEVARSFTYDYTAAVRVRQAIGRARRGPNDRVAIVLADNRFLRRSLREYLKLRIDSVVGSLEEYRQKICSIARQLGI